MKMECGAFPFIAPAGCYGYLNILGYENNITKKEEDGGEKWRRVLCEMPGFPWDDL